MSHHLGPSPWMLVFVAVDCKASLLGIAATWAHLPSHLAWRLEKTEQNVSEMTTLRKAFLAALLLNADVSLSCYKSAGALHHMQLSLTHNNLSEGLFAAAAYQQMCLEISIRNHYYIRTHQRREI